jgi:hypothetical protein
MKLADPRMPRRLCLRTGQRFGVLTLASGALLSAAALALTGCSSGGTGDHLALSAATSAAMSMTSSTAGTYQVVTLNDRRDLTFNQLLGINNRGVIAGYFGSGAAGHPNKGYELLPPFAQVDFVNENFPSSAQTQVTGLNDTGTTVGFWVNKAGANFGFYRSHGRFVNVNFPTGANAKPPVNQLLGVNNNGIAVGFYTNSNGSNRGYEFNTLTHQFSRVLVPGAPAGTAGPSLTAAGINKRGDVAGFYNKTATQVDAFLKLRSGRFVTIAFPGAASTQAFGVNDSDVVVGSYTVGTGNAAVTHGFFWKAGNYSSIDVQGASSTVINGINNEGDLVGFITDAAGNTDGLLALP